MPSGGYDFERAVKVAKMGAKYAQERSAIVTMTHRELVEALTDAYSSGWQEAIDSTKPRNPSLETGSPT